VQLVAEELVQSTARFQMKRGGAILHNLELRIEGGGKSVRSWINSGQTLYPSNLATVLKT
jgi:hypothetical protein